MSRAMASVIAEGQQEAALHELKHPEQRPVLGPIQHPALLEPQRWPCRWHRAQARRGGMAAEPAQQAAEQVGEVGVEGGSGGYFQVSEVPRVDSGPFHPPAVGFQEALDIGWEHGEVAAGVAPGYPEQGLLRRQAEALDGLDCLLDDNVEGDALPGVGAQALADGQLVLLQEPGVDALPAQVGHQQGGGEGVPAGEQEHLPLQLPGQARVYRQPEADVLPNAGSPGTLVVAEGAHPGFDARLVAGAGIVLVQLQDEVRLAVGVQDAPKVLDGKRIGGAAEGGDQHRIEPVHAGAGRRRLQEAGGVIPVEALQQGSYLPPCSPIGQDQVLVETFDAQGGED